MRQPPEERRDRECSGPGRQWDSDGSESREGGGCNSGSRGIGPEQQQVSEESEATTVQEKGHATAAPGGDG